MISSVLRIEYLNTLHSRMAYKFTFCRCNSTYVGMTNRHMRTRAYEHMGISPLTGANVKTT